MMIDGLKPYGDYKRAGLPWLDVIPAHWDLTPNRALMQEQRAVVGERAASYTLLSLTLGGVIPRNMTNPKGKFPAEFNTYKVVKPDDLVFCLFDIDETPRAVGHSKLDGMITGAYDVFSPRASSDSRFLFHYYLWVDQGKLLKPLYTGLRKTIQMGVFASLKTPNPPPEERNAIVRFLDHANHKIDGFIRAKRKLIALLDEQRQAIIRRAVARGLNPSVALRPSGVPWLGDIPVHWETWRVSRLAKIGNGSTPSRGKPEYWNGGRYPWLNSSHVNRGLIDSSDQFVTSTALRECHLPRVPANSVLVAITGQGKTRGMSAILTIDATINQHLAYITPKTSIVTPRFLHLALTAAYSPLRALSQDSGSTKGALTCEDLKRFKIPVPKLAEQRLIAEAIERDTSKIRNAVARIEREISLTQEYRMRLTADIVTGKFDVRSAVATLPDVPDVAASSPHIAAPGGEVLEESEIEEIDE